MRIKDPNRILQEIMNTTDAEDLNVIERSLAGNDDFYSRECDILFWLVGLKIDAHPHMIQSLTKIGTRYVANTCDKNARLGCGFNPDICRYLDGAYLAGKNYLGYVLAQYSSILKSAIKH